MEEIKKQMKEDCHNPEFITFFFNEAKRMTGMVAAFDETPERRAFCMGMANCEFRVIILALEVISLELPEKSEEATTLLNEMKKRESQIKQMFNLEK